MNSSENGWQTLDKFVEIRSPWLTLIGEHLQDNRGRILEYWRVEKADSAVILTLQNGNLILPPPTYRPGLGQATLDFAGGRVPPGQTPETAVPTILQRELGVETSAICHLTPLNTIGWAVNSSFSNQKLYGFVAELHPTAAIPAGCTGATYPATGAGVRALLDHLPAMSGGAAGMAPATGRAHSLSAPAPRLHPPTGSNCKFFYRGVGRHPPPLLE
ncbi:NUDIX hydrolase [Kamptonema formosum]|uniref:NUDIX hydrolase n=1 Tax=Kamptonema formosum TaxID=331992 RepID=UPI000349A1B9|nr:NUDIX hydrolase [Oscillatoria sp. PCC 10802]